MNRTVFAVLCLLLFLSFVHADAIAQPPFAPDNLDAVEAPTAEYGQRGPAIGIMVDNNQSISMFNERVRAVRVRSVTKKRHLWADNGRGQWQRYQFSPGYDYITHVNGASVATSSEVLQSTNHGWNLLKVYDKRNRSYRNYVIELP